MKAINIMRMCRLGGSGHLDTQTVTAAQTGGVGVRLLGYKASGPAQGSITTGTSAIYSAPITQMYADEFNGAFYLFITGATNTGWTTMNNFTDNTSLLRANAVYSAGTWAWLGQTLTGFFATTGTKTVYFD